MTAEVDVADQVLVEVELADVDAVEVEIGSTTVIYASGGQPFRFVHTQAVAATVWTITHNLNGYPNVTTIDPGGGVIVGTVDYVTVNQLTVTHGSPYAGTAYLS